MNNDHDILQNKLEEQLKTIEALNQTIEKLNHTIAFHQASFNNSINGIIVCDTNGVITLFNKTLRDWHYLEGTSLLREDLSTAALYNIDGVTPLEFEKSPLVKALNFEHVYNEDMAICIPDKPIRYIRANGSSFYDENGNKLGAVVILNDITSQFKKEEELQALNNNLEKMIQKRTLQLEDLNTELEEANASLEEEISFRQAMEEDIRILNRELEEKVLYRTSQLNEKNLLLSAIIESSPQVILFALDNNYCYTTFNKKHKEVILQIWGKEIEPGMNMLDIIGAHEDRKKAKMNFDRALSGESFTLTEEYGDEKLSRLYWQNFYSPIFSDKGKIIGLTCFVLNITDRVLAELNLKENERILQESQKIAHVGSYVIDLKNQTWKGTPELHTIYGIDETYPNSLEGLVKTIHPDSRKEFFEYHTKVKAGKNSFQFEHKIIRFNDGAVRWVSNLGVPRYDNDRLVEVIGTIQDITERKITEEEITFLSYHDKLTGIYNRRFCEEEIKRLDKERNIPISIIMGDVNGLKLVNDAFGHDMGDELLQKAAKAIQNACRTDDIVARWGGDEFIILLPKTTYEEVEEIIKRIKQQYLSERVNTLSISISFGWDTKNKLDEDVDAILRSAEDNMYKHKILENEAVRGNAINTIIKTLHEKSPREEQHSKRVSEICQKIGIAMNLPEIEVLKLKTVGLLHDIGKIAISEILLNKTEKLTQIEFDEIKQHPDIGYRIISSSYEMLKLADGILEHHERWDGKGYPKGLEGENISLIARIIAIADSYDAMSSDRPYRVALSEEVIISEICKNAGVQFDPVIARLFIEKVLGKPWIE